MSKRLQLRGGTTAEHATFTGAVREVTVDTTKDTLVVHDGTTAGGHALSTAADVSAALATLVDSAPATLNTLNELAAALGDDANFGASTTTAIGLRAPIASPTFTGDIGMPDGSIDDGFINTMSASKLTGDLPAISGANLTGVQPFPSGTVMVFHQTAAPTGWTKSTSHNDKALRVVSGNGGGNGGTHDLTSPPSLAHTHTGAAHVHSVGAHTHGNNLSAAAHTLTIAQTPSHTHTMYGWNNGANQHTRLGNGDTQHLGPFTIAGGLAMAAVGGGGSHSHSMSGSVSNSDAFNSSSAGDAATTSTTPTAFAPQYIDVIICAKD
jgi:hypothetical protein